MPLYTVIADYAGGTYVAQYRASSPRAVLAKWVRGSAEGILRSKKRDAVLRRRLTQPDSRPVPLSGLTSVWCCSFSVGRKLLLLNIVETGEAPNHAGAGNGATRLAPHVGRHSRAVPDQHRSADKSRDL